MIIKKNRSKGALIKYKYLLFVFVALLTACQASKPIDEILKKFHDSDSEYVMVVAHRARTGSQKYPENSIPAIQNAIDVGVDIIELDVKVTLDGVVVVNHDHTIDRTTTGTGNPEEYTWEELQKFKLKLPDGTVTDERLATFEEALNLAKGKVMIDIDLKTSKLQPVIDIVKETDMLNQVVFFDGSFDILKEVVSLCPEAMVMPRARSYEDTETSFQLFNSPPVIHIDGSFYTSELTSFIKSKKSRIWINSLGKGDEKIRDNKIDEVIHDLLKYDANIIQTDEAEVVLPYLESKELR